MTRFKFLCCVSVTSLAFTSPVFAQEENVDTVCLPEGCYSARKGFDPPTIEFDTILVRGSPLDVPKGDDAYATITIDPRTPRIEDGLRDVAGLTQFRRSDARSANATSQGATLRGLGGNASSRMLLTLDGVPQTDPFGGWVTWPAFTPARIGVIRVTRGGGSGSAGPGALAGTIDFESLSLVSRLRPRITAAYGSRNSVEANALLAGTLGKGAGLINLSYGRSGGFVPIIKSQRGAADIRSPYEQISLAARGIIPVNDRSELQASMLAFTDRRNRGTILSGNGGDGADASLRFVHKGDWGVEALGYAQIRKFQSRFVAIDAARNTVTQTVDQHNVPSAGLGAKIEVRPPIGSHLELRLGADWRRVAGRTDELFTYIAGNPTRAREAGGQNETFGGFAEAGYQNDALTLTGGVRLDRWTIRDGRLIERTLATGALIRNERASRRSGWRPTARGGIAYALGPAKLRSAAYLGWRLPTLNELYRPFRVGADATAANAGLVPERMHGAEVGFDLDFGKSEMSDSALIRTTAYANRLMNPIANVSLGAGPGVFPGVGFVAAGGAFRQRQNITAINARGVEVDARFYWDDAKWSLAASYAYTDAQIVARGSALPLHGLRPAQVPSHSASLTMGWRQISITARYVSAQFDDDLNLRRLKGALTFDANANLPISAQFRLTLRAENLANARVETAINGAGTIERATPRTIWVGVEAGF